MRRLEETSESFFEEAMRQEAILNASMVAGDMAMVVIAGRDRQWWLDEAARLEREGK